MTPLHSVFSQLVLEGLRTRRYQTAGCIASAALASASLLACIGIYEGIGPAPAVPRLMIGLWTSGLLLCVAAIAFFVLALGQYIEVRERTQDYGILRVLGASTRDFLRLVALESFSISIPGAVLGILLSYAAKGLVIVAFARHLTLVVSYACWPAAVLCSFCALLLGGLTAMRRTVREGVEEALSYRR